MLCRSENSSRDTSPNQAFYAICPLHCTRQYLIALKDTTSRRNSEANEEKFDLGILGLANKGVKVNKYNMIGNCYKIANSIL